MKKVLALLVAAGITLGACAGSQESSVTKGDAESAITAAKHELKRAKAIDYAWRDTGKLIKKAEAAMKDGDLDKAVDLANEAKMQSTLAIQQQKREKGAGPNYSL